MMSSILKNPVVYCVSMIEAAELTQQMGKTGVQRQETTASLAADTLFEATKEGAKGFVNGLMGFDHGAGHSLLLLYDAKTSHDENINDFNTLCYDLSTTFISLF